MNVFFKNKKLAEYFVISKRLKNSYIIRTHIIVDI